MTRALLDDDDEQQTSSSSSSFNLLKINEKYAQKYVEKKKMEELSILEDKYKEKLAQKGKKPIEKSKQDGDDEENDSEDDSSDDESDVIEDEDGELLTPAVEVQILKTLAEIRTKDEKIYNQDVNFFSPEELSKAELNWQKKQKEILSKGKPMRLKDFHREKILAGDIAPVEDDEDYEEEEMDEPLVKTHEQEQAEVLDAFKLAAKNVPSKEEGEEEEGFGLFKKRKRTQDEAVREEEDYKNFLLESLASSTNDHAKQSISEWFGVDGIKGRNAGGDGNAKAAVNEDEQFLVNFILNRGWIDKDRQALPSYDQIVAEDKEDEEAVDQMEEFEEKYNFRFEQPDGNQVTTHPRQVEGSMRREDEKRKEQRLAVRARKVEEKERQKEELKRLKNLKRAEIEERLAKIRSISGTNKKVDLDLESDFDPETHDKKMKKLFDEDYYGDEDDTSKPVYLSDNEEDDGLKTKTVEKITKKVTKAIKKAQAKLDSKEQAASASKYFDEYYQLDYEDMIEDLPCRFKYESIRPTTFGLGINDIFTADDQALNAHVSLKKLAPYRPKEVLENDEIKYSHKSRLYKFYDLVNGRTTGMNNDNKQTKRKKH